MSDQSVVVGADLSTIQTQMDTQDSNLLQMILENKNITTQKDMTLMGQISNITSSLTNLGQQFKTQSDEVDQDLTRIETQMKFQEEKCDNKSLTLQEMIDDIETQMSLNKNQTSQKGMTLMDQIAQINEKLVEHEERREDLAQELGEGAERLTNLEGEVQAGATESKAADDSILEAISRLEGDSESRDLIKHNFATHDQQILILNSVV